MTDEKKQEEQIHIVLDFRCKRCGAPHTQKAVVQCTIELSEHKGALHHCEDGGIGICDLVGFHDQS